MRQAAHRTVGPAGTGRCAVRDARTAAAAQRLLTLTCLLGLLWMPAAAGAARGGKAIRPQPLSVTEGRLLSVVGIDQLLLDMGSGPLLIRVPGVREDNTCAPERQVQWARQVLPAGTRIRRIDGGQRGVLPYRLALRWRDQTIDVALLWLRTGHALPANGEQGLAGLPPAYRLAARAARDEARGIWGECGRTRARFRASAERIGVPPDVLYGIALVESGTPAGPWPWTLNVAGSSYFYLTREAAWAQIRALQSQHFDLFDVGLMQVSWRYHHGRFRNGWEALDPKVNLRVAADILAENLGRTGSLEAAIRRYHSADPQRGAAYLARVRRQLALARQASGSPDAGHASHVSGGAE